MSIPTSRFVFIYRNDSWKPCRVLNAESGKVHVSDCDGGQHKYSERRVARVSTETVSGQSALLSYVTQLKGLKDSVDIESLWSLLVEEGEETSSLTDLVELAFPAPCVGAEDALAWALFGDSVYFKQKKDGSYATNSEIAVNESIRKATAQAEVQAEMDAMSQWILDPKEPHPPAAIQAIQALKALVLFDDDSRLCAKAKTLVRERFPSSSEPDTWLAWTVLRNAGVWKDDENLALNREAFRTVFTEEVLANAEQLAAQEPSGKAYADWCHLNPIAIDDARTTEVDDALAVETHPDGSHTIYVLVTDASAWIPKGCAVDEEANRRVATVYVPEGKIPMLPAVISQHKASLTTSQVCPVLGFVISLNSAGKFEGFEIERALIRLAQRMTYIEVEAILDGKEHPLQKDLSVLLSAADSMRQSRQETGALIIDRQEVMVNVDDNGEVEVVSYFTDTPSHRLVSEWMVQACAHVGDWCRERQIPAIYRTQERSEEATDRTLLRRPKVHELYQILRTMRRAELRVHPAPHAGLGVSCYTQATSPLRRLQDLVMHRQIKNYLDYGQPTYSEQDLYAVIAMNEQMDAARARVERESKRYWLLKSLESRRGNAIEVEVVRQIGRRYVLQLVENRLQTTWSPDRNVAPGDRLELTLSTVDARRDRLVLS